MSRKQERIRRKLESNPIAECNKVRNKYCPDLKLSDTTEYQIGKYGRSS